MSKLTHEFLRFCLIVILNEGHRPKLYKKMSRKMSTVKSKQEKFPAENLSSAFDCFDWLHSWIEAADWSMGTKLNFLMVS